MRVQEEHDNIYIVGLLSCLIIVLLHVLRTSSDPAVIDNKNFKRFSCCSKQVGLHKTYSEEPIAIFAICPILRMRSNAVSGKSEVFTGQQ